MSKRGNPSEQQSTLRITGGQIKGYHEFKIKGPEGTPFHVYPENGNTDPFALMCVLPDLSDLPESLLDVPLVSRSEKKTYTLREVAGRQLGRVQYFLNRELKHLLDCGKIYRIEGNITGQPTTTKRTPVHQKWKRNVQQGGGAFIPCEWKVRCKGECLEEVENRLKLALAEMGNEGSGMSIEISERSPSLAKKKKQK